ncbi:hypothetical protein MCOR07_004699, partial [Pyricularia oryzae]
MEFSPDCPNCRIYIWLRECTGPDYNDKTHDVKDRNSTAKLSPTMSVEPRPITPPSSSSRQSSPHKRQRVLSSNESSNEPAPLIEHGDRTPRQHHTFDLPRRDIVLLPSHYHNTSRVHSRKSRSTSPVKKTIDLERLEKPIRPTPLQNAFQQLPDVLELHQYIDQVMESETAFIPAGARPLIQELQKNTGAIWKNDWFQQQEDSSSSAMTEAQLRIELDELLEIHRDAYACLEDAASEHSMNIQVHYPLLRLAAKTCPGVKTLPVTTARMSKHWMPPMVAAGVSSEASSFGARTVTTETEANEVAAVVGKMVDFIFVFDESVDTQLGAAIRKVLRKDKYLSINHSDYGPIRFRPTGIPIETKISSVADSGRTQLLIWAAGWFARMEAWVRKQQRADAGTEIKVPSTLPVILVVEHDWKLSYVCDRGDRFDFVHEISIGGTKKLSDMYRLLAVLRALLGWMDTDLR